MFDPCLTRPVDHPQHDGAQARAARILRNRQAEQVAAVDRASAVPSPQAARRLVSIYNGGRMPNQPDYVYFAHPVDLDGNEIEGGAASPNPDASATIPVVVLWHPPEAGDLLVATSVGGRWVAERGATVGTRICVTACGNLPVPGATITLLSGTRNIATSTTGPDGCSQFLVAGTYTVQVAIGGTVAYEGLQTLPSGGTTTISAGSSGLICCGGYAIPQVLTLTDAEGTIQLVYDSTDGLYLPTWFGGHAVTRLSSTVTTPNNICTAQPASQGPVRVCYQMTCNAGQNPTFKITRSWSWVYQQSNTPIWFQDPTGFTPGRYCITAPPPQCGNPLTDTAAFGTNPLPGGPFALSGSPTPTASNATSDPIGGSIAISV